MGYVMKNIVRDHIIWLVAVLIYAAVLAATILSGYAPYEAMFPVLLLSATGFSMLFWGIYCYRKEVVTINWFTMFLFRKDRHKYYDSQKMGKDLGKVMIVIGTIFLITVPLIILTGLAETTVFGDTESYFRGTFLAFVIMFPLLLAMAAAPVIMCKSKKYLKDPSVRPPP
jgi:hypothetical protein